MSLQINLVDINSEMTNAWSHFFNDQSNVKVYTGSIFDINSEAIISPGNSFGFMDGGLDLIISKKLGWEIQTELRNRINSYPNAELLVGQAEIIPTNDRIFKHVIAAPTMRIPMNLSKTINVYLASKAIFNIAIENKLKSISISGLGTGTGKLSFELCAKQMHIIIKTVLIQIPNLFCKTLE